MTRMGLHPGMSDAVLCQLLLNKASLTDDQLTDMVAAAARVAAGGRLYKHERDRAMAIMLAQGLGKKTQFKKRANPNETLNVANDLYSTRATDGTAKAEEILKRGRTPSGHMIAPPGKRRAG